MYQFQGKSARLQYWFNLYPEWIEYKFMTREAEFFKRLHLKHIPGLKNKYSFTFSVPIGTAKKTQVQFQSDTPTMAYRQHEQDSCCFSSLASAFVVSK